MGKKVTYHLNKRGEFIINNYNLAKSFSSFFPGIAGIWGIPVWVFYVNRGQAIASFGIKDKDHPVMEFQPANKAYYLTPVVGFRTFIKTKSGRDTLFYDAFSANSSFSRFDTQNSMSIRPDGITLKETNRTLGIEVVIDYFSIPGDNYGALARKLTIKNAKKLKRSLEVLDGMPQIQPYGINNMFLKQMSRTIEAWIMVENHNKGIPFIRLKVEPDDRPEVVHIRGGNFYAAFDRTGLVKPVVETGKIFGLQDDFVYPKAFINARSFAYPERQHVKSKTPCAFAYKKVDLKPLQEYSLYTITGNMAGLDKLKSNARRIMNIPYFESKEKESREVTASLSKPVFTASSSGEFDSYCAQNFLDNIMRGGSPVSVEHASGKTNLYLYSRKHGDLERDYNMFLVEPTYLSQGNGNYRDVNQNRRCDIWFNTGLKDENILNFFNLIQTDGYNPLVVKPDRFRFNQDFNCLSNFFNRVDTKKIKEFLKDDFTPGELFLFIEKNNIGLSSEKYDFIKNILENSGKYNQADHGEGFWIDHWHYCLDALESYLRLYPEGLKDILFDRKDFTFYDNAHIVKPRSEKYVFENNRIRQYGSVSKEPGKAALINRRKLSANVSRTDKGKGEIFRTTLAVKMLVVIANKFSNLDLFCAGIEMEAGKPNWYDSLNGLPGLLGSSTCETFELKRWILFLIESVNKLKLDDKFFIYLPSEVYGFLTGLESLCRKNESDNKFWDKRHSLKEKYRKETIFGFAGSEKRISIKKINSTLKAFLKKIDKGLARAYDKDRGLYYSYFINSAVDFKITKSKNKRNDKIRVLKFKQIPLPFFLEGMVHAFRINDKRGISERYYKAVRRSALFDKKLKMYKVCAPLHNMPEEIGRCRIFTPGWLENESIWLHMEYKYMLELLKSGLYGQFYDDFKNVLVPFLDPSVYGRSILENSSFIASSVFSKKEQRGNGFVARLSGSTAEFINMWLIMCVGKEPFYLDRHNRLCAEFKPVLPGWLFTKKKSVMSEKATFSFKFLNRTLVVYHNKSMKDTFGKNPAKARRIHIKLLNGEEVTLNSPHIPAPYSYHLRQGKIDRLDIELRGRS